MRVLLTTILLTLTLWSRGWGAHTFNADSTIITITSFPDVINQTDHRAGAHANDYITIKLASHVMTATSTGPIGTSGYYYCLSFNTGTHHWVMDLTGTDGIGRTADDDSLRFGADRNNLVWAVIMSGTSHDLKFRGGVYQHTPVGLTGTETTLPANYTTYRDNINFRILSGTYPYNISFDTLSALALASWATYALDRGAVNIVASGRNLTVNNCNLRAIGLACEDRQVSPHRNVSADGLVASLVDFTNPSSYHVRIYGGQLYSTFMDVYADCGYAVQDSIKIQMYACSLTIDNMNLYRGGTYASTTNSYAAHIRKPGRGSYIRKCYVTSGSTRNGGRGVEVEHWKGTEAYPIYIDSNVFYNMHEGCNPEFSEAEWCTAIKARNGRSYLRIEKNTVSMLADTCSAYNYYTGYFPKVIGIMYQRWGATYPGPRYDKIINNTVTASAVTKETNDRWRISAISFDDIAGDPTIQSIGNRITTEQFAYDMGHYDGPAQDIVTRNDTITINTTYNLSSRNGVFFAEVQPSIGHKFYDLTFPSTSWDTSLGFSYYYGFTASASLYRTVNVDVGGSNGRPVSGATVTATDAYGHLVASAVTNSVGRATVEVKYWYDVNGTGDSTAFNQFVISATKGVDVASHNKTITALAGDGEDDITLTATLGDGMWPGAADLVEYRTTLEDRNRQRNLPGPKSQVLPLRNARQTVSFLQWNNDNTTGDTMPQFVRVADGAQTERRDLWSTRTSPCAGSVDVTDIPEAYYEAELSLANGDTIVYTANRSCVYPAVAHVVRIDANGTLTFIDTQNVATDVAGTYRPMGMAAYRGNRSIVIPIRASSAGGSGSDIRMITSSNNGTTWNPMQSAFSWATAGDKRVDGDEYIDGSIWFSGITAVMNPLTSTGEMRTAVYNGTTWTMDNVYPARGYYSREYASVIQQDGTQHLLFSDTGATGQASRITHLYKPFGSGAWQSKTLYTATVHTGQAAGSLPLPVGLTYTQSSDCVRAFYCKQDSMLFSREWLDTGWTTTETAVSEGRLLNALTTCNSVPTIHGDRAYVQYLERYGATGYRTVLATVLGDGTTGGVVADPTGACCLPSYSCITATAVDCAAQGGTYQGDGVACGGVDCGSPPVITATKVITGTVTITGNVRIE